MTILGLKPLDFIGAIAVLGYFCALAWRGYRRRRRHWTPGSWLGFGLTLLVAFALVGFSLFFSAAIDNHEPWVGARGSNTRALWIVAAMFSMVGGSGLAALSVAWLAQGKPKKPFPLFASKRRKELGASAAEPLLGYGQNVTPTPAVMNVDHEGPKRSA